MSTSMSRTLPEIVALYHNGDRLTDEELTRLNDAAGRLAMVAGSFGVTTAMAHAYAQRICDNTSGYIRARLEKSK